MSGNTQALHPLLPSHGLRPRRKERFRSRRIPAPCQHAPKVLVVHPRTLEPRQAQVQGTYTDLQFSAPPTIVFFFSFLSDIFSSHQEAVSALTHPSLLPVFPSEILAALLRAGEDSLALSYYNTMLPSLTPSSLLDAYFAALCRASVTEAFYFMRRQPAADGSRRKALVQSLVRSALSLPPGADRKQKCTELLDLPFDADEEGWFEEFLTTGRGKALRLADDVLVMRRLTKGSYGGVLEKLGAGAGTPTMFAGVTWENIAEGLNSATSTRRKLDGFKVG
jgi:hypothetical protein